jgi:hypothetical protein
MTDKQLNTITEYFKFINPYRYDHLEIKYSSDIQTVFIFIYCDSISYGRKYFKQYNFQFTVLQNLTLEMEQMFPYDFYLNCKVKTI